MCLGHKDNNNDPAPKPAQIRPSSSIANPKASMPQDYAPPPGPPPSYRQNQSHSYPSQSQPQPQPQPQSQSTYYAPPPGPPPSHSRSYQPPAGPPSSDTKNNPFFNQNPNPGSQDEEYAPPPGPPPSHGQSSKPQHDWQTAVPDTALLPPPPNFFAGYDHSPANNASQDQCEAGESWCREHPLYHPAPLNAKTNATVTAVQNGNITVYAPPFYFSKGGSLTQTGLGIWRGQSTRRVPDSCLTTWPPLYQASAHSPLTTGRRKIVYYEVRILPETSRSDEISLALGFSAPPYPAFRLPGWHRGSVAVHGDDGHKYINDRWGGKDFTAPFRKGETIGIGMEFSARKEGGLVAQVFLTRDGVERGRWDLHEETDKEQDLPVTGLEGYHDLCASVGCFEKVGFEMVFVPALWKWRGYEG